jgi:hypothetical protein
MMPREKVYLRTIGQDVELVNFGENLEAKNLAINPRLREGILRVIVEGFVQQMLLQGYIIGTINNLLSTIKNLRS